MLDRGALLRACIRQAHAIVPNLNFSSFYVVIISKEIEIFAKICYNKVSLFGSLLWDFFQDYSGSNN